MLARIVKLVVVVVILIAAYLVGIRTMPVDPHQCLLSPCVYADYHGDAGLYDRSGAKYEAVGRVDVFTQVNSPTRVTIMGVEVDNLTGIETAGWTAIDIYVDGGIIDCLDSYTLSWEQIKNLSQLTYYDANGYIRNPLGLCQKVEELVR